MVYIYIYFYFIFKVCNFNTRRVGGYLSTDHKVDFLRNALVHALNKSHTLLPLKNANLVHDSSSSSNFDHLSSTKPILARKLQSTTHSYLSNNNKETHIGLTVSVGHNAFKQQQHNNSLIDSGAISNHSSSNNNNNTNLASLKRNSHSEVVNQHHLSNVNTGRGCKTKKVKANEVPNSVNYFGNIVQLDSVNSRNHFPVVAVTLQNGITNPQTITFGNVPIAGVRNASNPPIKLHTPIALREADNRNSNSNNNSDSTNFVLTSGIPGGSIVIADTVKSMMKSDAPQGATAAIKFDASKLYSSKSKFS